jgi:hypothetical protein
MTNHTPHGQVPEALIDLIDTYAETRYRYGGVYNARTEAARNAVIEALSGVQALSAAPAIAKLRHLYQNMVNGAVRDTASAKRIAEGLLAPAIEALERATPPAEQQAAPKAAPAPLSELPYEKQNAIQEGEQIGASDAWFKARHEMLDTIDRRNVFRAGFVRGWNAAIAAQGGKV